ncbi:SNF2 family N-terminal domain-containing protein [Cladochytrium replicatum]|nr:SNF2 family N-terminal domain-containing protein [Cladochytrium replicatum]
MLKMEQGKNHGGILADDMGLGKTIQSIATILLNPPPKEERKARTTLVVAPVSLLRQWELEIRRKVVGGTLKVLLYHGPKRPKKVEALSKFDVILTSYSIVSAEWPNKKRKKKKNKKGKEAEGEADKDFDVNIEDESPDEMMKRAGPLFFMTYHRIILDEAHTIKNHAIQTSISACALEAKHRWCLTGTPFQNNLLELYSLLRFLQISPYNDKNRFASHITSQFKRGRHMTVLKRVQAILAACCFRRTKKAILDGRPIIDLPPKTVQWFQDPFTDDEQKFYRALETESALQFNKYLKQDTVMKNYANILVLLLKLRQAACHPGLVTVKVDPNEERMLLYDGQSSSSSKPSKTTRLLTSMKKEVVRRLLEEDSGLRGECAICMDVVADGVLLVECGHSFCRECLDSYYKTVEHDPLCPTCRGTLDIDETLPVAVFLAHHRPSKAAPEGKGKEPATDTTEQQVSSTKINRMMEILEERRTNAPKDKIIIFSHFVKMLDMIETILLVRGFQFVRYDGQMTPDERAAAVEDLERDPDLNIILVSKKCGSLGLNLVCCNIVILLDIWWNPAVDNQAIDRVHRLGQRKEVKVYRLLIANTIEDRILELQKMKQKLCDASLGEGDPAEGGSFNARLGVEDLIYLFRVNQDEELPEAFS